MLKFDRIAYLAGMEDLPRTHSAWLTGTYNSAEMSVEYSRFVMNLVQSLQAVGFLSCVSQVHDKSVRGGRIQVEQVRRLPNTNTGLRYHIAEALWGWRRMVRVLRTRPNLVVMDSGNVPLYLANLPWLLRKRQVIVLHSALWPVLCQPRRIDRLLLLLASPALRSARTVVIGPSRAVVEQVTQIYGVGSTAGSRVFLPRYLRDWPGGTGTPRSPARPWQILVPGRIEESKGVYDILEVVKILLENFDRNELRVTIAGTGSQLEELRGRVAAQELGDVITVPGFFESAELRELFKEAHIVVAPTRTSFRESFNRVLAEAVLARRPVVTSRASPGHEYVGDAVVLATADDPLDYARALAALMSDPDFYEAKVRACPGLSAQFLDGGHDMGAALDAAVRHLREGACPSRKSALGRDTRRRRNFWLQALRRSLRSTRTR